MSGKSIGLVLIGLAVVVVIAFIGFVSPPAEEKGVNLPESTDLVAKVSLSAYRNVAKDVKDLVENITGKSFEDIVKERKKPFPVKPEEINEVVVWGDYKEPTSVNESIKGDGGSLFKFRESKRDNLTAYFQNKGYEEEKYKGYTLYKNTEKKPLYFVFLNEKTLAVGNYTSSKMIVDAQVNDEEISQELKTELNKAGRGIVTGGFLVSKRIMEIAKEEQKMTRSPISIPKPYYSVRAGNFLLNIENRKIKTNVSLLTNSSNNAEEIKTQAKGLISYAKTSIPPENAPEGVKEMYSVMKDVLNQIVISKKGKRVEFSSTVAFDQIKKLAKVFGYTGMTGTPLPKSMP